MREYFFEYGPRRRKQNPFAPHGNPDTTERISPGAFLSDVAIRYAIRISKPNDLIHGVPSLAPSVRPGPTDELRRCVAADAVRTAVLN